MRVRNGMMLSRPFAVSFSTMSRRLSRSFTFPREPLECYENTRRCFVRTQPEYLASPEQNIYIHPDFDKVLSQRRFPRPATAMDEEQACPPFLPL